MFFLSSQAEYLLLALLSWHLNLYHYNYIVFFYIFLFSLPLGLWKKSNHVIQLPKQLSGRRIRLPMQEMQETCIQPLGQEDPLEEEMATHCRHLAWRIPWTDELQSMGATVHGVGKSQV